MNVVVFVETVRRHLTSVLYLLIFGFLCMLAFVLGKFGLQQTPLYTPLSLVALLFGAQLIGPEFSSGTLQLILSKPVNRSQYIIGRLAGVMVSVLIALWVPLLVWAGFHAMRGGQTDWQAIFATTGAVSLHLLMICTLLTLLGALTRAYFNVAIWFVLYFGFDAIGGILKLMRMGRGSVAQFIAAHPGILRALRIIDQNLFVDVPGGGITRDYVLMVLANASIALVLACLAFRVREVPYGAD